MSIGSISNCSAPNGSFSAARGSDPFSKAKQAFDDLGSALKSGSLSDAKEALVQLQKTAPPQGQQTNGPLGGKLTALSKALDSGDLNGAKDAYADIKATISQRPQNPAARSRGGPAGGSPAGGPPAEKAKAGAAAQGSSASDSANSSKVYDPRDTNKDSKVSIQEEIAYDLQHAAVSPTASGSSNIRGQRTIDLFA